jgi:hypothetical protein
VIPVLLIALGVAAVALVLARLQGARAFALVAVIGLVAMSGVFWSVRNRAPALVLLAAAFGVVLLVAVARRFPRFTGVAVGGLAGLAIGGGAAALLHGIAALLGPDGQPLGEWVGPLGTIGLPLAGLAAGALVGALLPRFRKPPEA